MSVSVLYVHCDVVDRDRDCVRGRDLDLVHHCHHFLVVAHVEDGVLAANGERGVDGHRRIVQSRLPCLCASDDRGKDVRISSDEHRRKVSNEIGVDEAEEVFDHGFSWQHGVFRLESVMLIVKDTELIERETRQ